jgi:predicted AAA+ superfamily ATPase
MKRAFVDHLKTTLLESPKFIQVILGPRQVGKTTGVLQLKDELTSFHFIYENADLVFSSKIEWLKSLWINVRGEAKKYPKVVLVIDEVQSIADWSKVIKGLWDHEKKEKTLFHVVLLGSSSLELHQGLSESLAGRFEMTYVGHWGYQESKKLSPEMTLDNFLNYGGYPELLLIKDEKRRLNYLKNSIVEPVISKDILQNVGVKKPALFRQVFELVCLHAGEILSLNKLLGQLQEGGNVDLVKYYLRLYEQAYLIKTLEKFTTNKIQMKGSSPKLLPRANALLGVFEDISRGRKFEVMVGCHLLEKYQHVFYWREADKEVDYVIKLKNKIIAIEVKSGRKKDFKGLEAFSKKFPCKTLLLNEDNFEQIDELISDLCLEN